MSDGVTHKQSVAWGYHVWNRCYRGSKLISEECDVCGVTSDDWLREAVLTIHVTDEDIRQATESDDPERVVDPVELALAREAGLDDPMILPPGYQVVGNDYNLPLPEKAAALVRRFLKGKPVEPITFLWWPGRGYLAWAMHRIPRCAP